MQTKAYTFKPLYKTHHKDHFQLAEVVSLLYLVLVVIACYGFGVTWAAYIVPLLLRTQVFLYKSTVLDWTEISEFETVRINRRDNSILLDSLEIPISDIAHAEVLIENKGKMWGFCDFGMNYSELVNASIVLSLKDNRNILVTVQMKSCLLSMIATLKDYIPVKYDEKNKYINESAPVWIWLQNTAFFWLLWVIFWEMY